jgi:dienelactone hydrolase
MTPLRWNFERLAQAPAVHPAPGFESEGLRALFFDGLPWRGKPTRVFAYLGIPKRSENEKVPGIVLVHGGLGTAFAGWVKLWNARGYAAIALDTCGSAPHEEPGAALPVPVRHDHGGPAGWGGFDQVDDSETDQWPYHGVANVVLAHSLLRSQPEVDAERIGITGISWGGFLTCLSASVDSRFRFAAPVYGCGFLEENSKWLPDFQQMGREKADAWRRLWDPSLYLPRAGMPFLWTTGTNDVAFPLDSFQKSYRLPSGPRTLSVAVRMKHGQGPGQNPEEIRAFADSVLNNGEPLVRITRQSCTGDLGRVFFDSPSRVVKAELDFTRDSGPWVDRLWETLPAEIDKTRSEASASIPESATVFYFNLTDEKGLIVSSEHVERRR